MNRFRPNIVISGWPEPHPEDRVGRMTIGGTETSFGELAGYRREPDGVSFGLTASVLAPGDIAVGDGVTVTEWR